MQINVDDDTNVDVFMLQNFWLCCSCLHVNRVIFKLDKVWILGQITERFQAQAILTRNRTLRLAGRVSLKISPSAQATSWVGLSSERGNSFTLLLSISCTLGHLNHYQDCIHQNESPHAFLPCHDHGWQWQPPPAFRRGSADRHGGKVPGIFSLTGKLIFSSFSSSCPACQRKQVPRIFSKLFPLNVSQEWKCFATEVEKVPKVHSVLPWRARLEVLLCEEWALDQLLHLVTVDVRCLEALPGALLYHLKITLWRKVPDKMVTLNKVPIAEHGLAWPGRRRVSIGKFQGKYCKRWWCSIRFKLCWKNLTITEFPAVWWKIWTRFKPDPHCLVRMKLYWFLYFTFYFLSTDQPAAVSRISAECVDWSWHFDVRTSRRKFWCETFQMERQSSTTMA